MHNRRSPCLESWILSRLQAEWVSLISVNLGRPSRVHDCKCRSASFFHSMPLLSDIAVFSFSFYKSHTAFLEYLYRCVCISMQSFTCFNYCQAIREDGEGRNLIFHRPIEMQLESSFEFHNIAQMLFYIDLLNVHPF